LATIFMTLDSMCRGFFLRGKCKRRVGWSASHCREKMVI
jgi:hypothetical protein